MVSLLLSLGLALALAHSEPEKVIPLLARYVGTLPSTGQRASHARDVNLRFPAQIQRAQVALGREPRSQAVVSFFADPPPEAPSRSGLPPPPTS
jgi:hypothetical protein